MTFHQLLDLDQIEANIFRGIGREGAATRAFGGLVAAQSLMAAGRTVPEDRPVHSLHAYFLLPGDAGAPTVYVVDRIRDGRSFTTRRVSAVQHGKTIFHLSASFHHHETGPEHQNAGFESPPPESLPTMAERFAPYLDRFGDDLSRWAQSHPVEVRYVGEPPPLAFLKGSHPAQQLMWFRSRDPLAGGLIQVCAATYASDLYMLSTTLLSHNGSVDPGTVSMASLDHAMWFHGPFRADEWLLYVQDSPWSGGARGLARGQIFTRDGRLVISVMQEGLLRSIGR